MSLIGPPMTPGKTNSLPASFNAAASRIAERSATAGEKLGRYVRGSSLSAELQKKMVRIVALRKLMGTTEDKLERLRQKRADSLERASELRENIKAIEKTAAAEKLRKMLLDRLADVTKQLDDISVEMAKQGDEAAMARAELDDAVRDLVIEESLAPAPALPSK